MRFLSLQDLCPLEEHCTGMPGKRALRSGVGRKRWARKSSFVSGKGMPRPLVGNCEGLLGSSSRVHIVAKLYCST
jgi:hypothetical protein